MKSKLTFFLQCVVVTFSVVTVIPGGGLFSSSNITNPIAPYSVPGDHLLHHKLDEIFTKDPNAFESIDSLIECGFTVLFNQEKSKIVVVKHPLLEGYLIKGYLRSEMKPDFEEVYWRKLLDRCVGAENIRKLIKRKGMKYFTVPDKWLYTLPDEKNTVILIVTDMRLTSHYESRKAWKEKVDKKHLNELYAILSRGYASCWLVENIPYTLNGTFSCIDTEYPQRKLDCKKAEKYFSPKMQKCWDKLLTDH